MLIASWMGRRMPWIDRYHYFISVFAAGLLLVSSGCVLAWPSPNTIKIRTGQTPVEDGHKDVTGVGYIFFIGCVPGFFLSWLFLTYAGRRAGMLAAALLYAVSWMVMAFATTLSWVYGARLIQGMAQTISLVIAPVYIVEISQVSLREVSGFSMQFFFNTGLLVQYVAGPLVSYICLICINLGIALIFIVCFLLLAHETPYYLLMSNRTFEAEKVLRLLRNHIRPPNEEQIQNELAVIQNMLKEREKCSTWNQIKLLMLDKAMRRALVIIVGLTYLFVFSGLSQLLMFAEIILWKAEVAISPSLSCIFIGVVKLIGGFTLPFIVKPFGIKRISICSTTIASISMFFLALFFFMKNKNHDMESFFWAPLILFLVYFLCTAIGLSFLVMHVRAEIFPPHIKPTGILLQEIVSIISLEICSIFFTQLLDHVYIPLWFFSGSMLLSVIFMACMLPESNSMTLHDIQKWLKK